jgi:hypothetical protein
MTLCVNHVVAEMCKPLARYARFTFTCTSNVHVRKRQFYPLDSTKTQNYYQGGIVSRYLPV